MAKTLTPEEEFPNHDCDLRLCTRCYALYTRFDHRCYRCSSPEFSLVLKSEVAGIMAKHQTTIERQVELKKQYPDTLLLFRMGDFYELFHEDAKTASRVLGLTLTTREKGTESPVAMAGFPFHQLENYLRKLIQTGYRAAACDQAEPNKGEIEVTATKARESHSGAGRVNPQSKGKVIAPNKKGKAGKSRTQGPVVAVPESSSVVYNKYKMIRDIALSDKPDPNWKPAVGDLVFIPATVREYVSSDYSWKQFPTLSTRALLGVVIAHTQAPDLVKIRDVTDQVWKVSEEKVKRRFVLVSSLRPFRGWDIEAAKRLPFVK